VGGVVGLALLLFIAYRVWNREPKPNSTAPVQAFLGPTDLATGPSSQQVATDLQYAAAGGVLAVGGRDPTTNYVPESEFMRQSTIPAYVPPASNGMWVDPAFAAGSPAAVMQPPRTTAVDRMGTVKTLDSPKLFVMNPDNQYD
jgi:hypothetical protein